MRVFISYRRASGRWAARAVRQALQRRGIDSFLDVEDINAGRFVNVICNEIDACDHLVAILDSDTLAQLGSDADWVGREISRAMEFGKNVVPLLVDDSALSATPAEYAQRDELMGLNALRLDNGQFESGIDTLVNRFLTQPGLQEVRRKTAEEQYEAGMTALRTQEWAAARDAFDRAAAVELLPEYVLNRGMARYQLGEFKAALEDAVLVRSLDPFAYEPVELHMACLESMGQRAESVAAYVGRRKRARSVAYDYAQRIFATLDGGASLDVAVTAVPELGRIFSYLTGPERTKAAAECLVAHLPDDFPSSTRMRRELERFQLARSPGPSTPAVSRYERCAPTPSGGDSTTRPRGCPSAERCP